MRNPYTPTFGVTPPLLVGRDEILTDFAEGLEDGVGSPSRAILITGTRASGKTVLLNALEDIVVEKEWVVISLTTRPGIAQELVETILPRYLSQYVSDSGNQIKQIQATVLEVAPVRSRDYLLTPAWVRGFHDSVFTGVSSGAF